MPKNSFALGNYRDRFIEAEKLLRSLEKPILESAVQDFLANSAQFYHNDGNEIKHRLTGNTLEDDIAKLHETKPHWFADFNPEKSDADIENEIIREAVTNPSPKTLAKLFKAVGELRYNTIIAHHGVDVKRMTPGSMESGEKSDAKDRKSNPKSNPWSAAGWSLKAQGALITAIGVEKAAQFAAAVGCRIGSTRPNPKFN